MSKCVVFCYRMRCRVRWGQSLGSNGLDQEYDGDERITEEDDDARAGTGNDQSIVTPDWRSPVVGRCVQRAAGTLLR